MKSDPDSKASSISVASERTGGDIGAPELVGQTNSGGVPLPVRERAEAAFAIRDYQEGERLFIEAIAEEKRRVPADRRTVVLLLVRAAESALAYANSGAAIGHLTEAEALSDISEHPLEWSKINHILALALRDTGDYEAAERLLRQVVDLRSRHLSPESSETLSSRTALGNVLRRQGKLDAAEQEHTCVLSIRERVLGADDPETMKSQHNLISVLIDRDELERAEGLMRDLINSRDRVLGPDHPDTLSSRNTMAIILKDQGRFEDSIRELSALVRDMERVHQSNGHHHVLSARLNLADTRRMRGASLLLQGKEAEARTEFEAAREEFEALHGLRLRLSGVDHAETATVLQGWGVLLEAMGSLRDAEIKYREALRIRRERLPSLHRERLRAHYLLAGVLCALKSWDDAEEHAKIALTGAQELLGSDHSDTKAYSKRAQQIASERNH
ncbi:MAG: tetratricopeptide repeat protein [Planctomycetes bacterium]|nr:tetratricopeptide repeat protein [Planctomycetota bacterium]